LNLGPVGISIYRIRVLSESAPPLGDAENFLERSNIKAKKNVAFVDIARQERK